MRIGKKTTNPGELRVPVILESTASSQDSGGFTTRTYTTEATVYARWVNLHGREIFDEGVVAARLPARVLIRYRSDIKLSWTVVMDGERYEILSMDNIRQRGEYIEMIVQRSVGG